jgi:hypothetical protein
MKPPVKLVGILSAAALLLAIEPVAAQVLYMQNFDVDDSANWTVNNGPSDEAHDFFFDYNTVGIPSAPNSTGGTTRGMKLQANLFDAIFSGMSVSPNGQSFTGDYTVSFDWWANYMGPVGPGAAGSTMLSTFGIETSGTFANWPSSADATFFAITSDGNSTADFRVYSPERAVSYQLPHDPAIVDNQMPPQPRDSHATYLGNSRQNNVEPYITAFPGGQMAPALQQTNFPASQTGTTIPGAAGFQWNEMEIRKAGNLVRLFANGVELMNVDMTNYVTPNGGTNIMFGQSDINATTNIDPNYPTLQFGLFDNIKVTQGVVAAEDADFDGNGDVDGADFLIWQKNLGISDGSATLAQGDANDDGNVTAADLDVWKAQFATPGGGVSAVPEPATWASALIAMLVTLLAALPRRRRATVSVRVTK